MLLMRNLPLAATILLGCSWAPATGAKPVFTTTKDQDGTVYHIDFEQVRSPRDLTAIPGIKVAWYQHGAQLNGWLANAGDVDGDGTVELFLCAARDDTRRIVRYDQDGSRAWESVPIGDPLGGESGLAIVDLEPGRAFRSAIPSGAKAVSRS